MASFGFDQSLSFPTAGQGNDDSGNEIKVHPELNIYIYFFKITISTFISLHVNSKLYI